MAVYAPSLPRQSYQKPIGAASPKRHALPGMATLPRNRAEAYSQILKNVPQAAMLGGGFVALERIAAKIVTGRALLLPSITKSLSAGMLCGAVTWMMNQQDLMRRLHQAFDF